MFGWRRDARLNLVLLGPEQVRVQTGLLPGLLTESTDHVPGFAATILEWPLRGDTILASNDAPIWPRDRQDAIDECPRLGCFRTVWSFVQIDEHDPA